MFNNTPHRLNFRVALIFTVLLSVSLSVYANPGDKDDPHHADNHHSNTHLAIFFGTASVSGHTDFLIGSDLEFRLPFLANRFGVGVLADAILAEHTHMLAAGGLFIHPIAGVKVVAAPGAGFEEGHSAFVFHTGLSYDFHIDSISISPTFNLDFSEGHTTQTFGFALGASL